MSVPISTSHTSLPACLRIQSWGSHRPSLAEPLLLSGLVPGFAQRHLSSSPVRQPSVYWRKSKWNTAEQIIIHREGMRGICNHTAWMLGSSICDRRGKPKWKVRASWGQLYTQYAWKKIGGDSSPNSGTNVRPELTPAHQAEHITHASAKQSLWKLSGWWSHVQPHPTADCTGQEKSLQWCKSRITSPVVTHGLLYIPDLMALKAFQMFRHLKLGKDFNLGSPWVHPRDTLFPPSGVLGAC